MKRNWEVAISMFCTFFAPKLSEVKFSFIDGGEISEEQTKMERYISIRCCNQVSFF